MVSAGFRNRSGNVQLRVVTAEEVDDVGEVRGGPPFEKVLGEGEGALQIDLAEEEVRVPCWLVGEPGEDVDLALCDYAWNRRGVNWSVLA